MPNGNGDTQNAPSKPEPSRPGWSSPLAIALLVVAFAIVANAGVLLVNGLNRHAIADARQDLAENKAEADRILDAIRTGNPDRAAANLDFLVKAKLIDDDERRDAIAALLKERQPGQGPALPSAAPRSPASRPLNARADLADRWFDDNGRYIFPSKNLGYEDGCIKPEHELTLAAGTVIDRYGAPGGTFLAPVGTSYEARALPYDKTKMPYYRYEVLKELKVLTCEAVPWFDQAGGGAQYKVDKPVQQLLDGGFLRDVSDR